MTIELPNPLPPSQFESAGHEYAAALMRRAARDIDVNGIVTTGIGPAVAELLRAEADGAIAIGPGVQITHLAALLLGEDWEQVKARVWPRDASKT